MQEDMGALYGGPHADGSDLAALLSCIVGLSDLPLEYEQGRFHILALGVYIYLGEIDVVYFTGHLRHGGTPPLTPDSVEKKDIEPWAYRCVAICYPVSHNLFHDLTSLE